jgi:hypothetical protein
MFTIKQLNARSNALAKSAATLSINVTKHCVNIVEHVKATGDVSAFTYLVNAFGSSAVRKEAITVWANDFGGARYIAANVKTGKAAKFVRNAVKLDDLVTDNLPGVFEHSKEKVATINAIDLPNLIKGLVKRVEDGASKTPTKAGKTHNIPTDMLTALKAIAA